MEIFFGAVALVIVFISSIVGVINPRIMLNLRNMFRYNNEVEYSDIYILSTRIGFILSGLGSLAGLIALIYLLSIGSL